VIVAEVIDPDQSLVQLARAGDHRAFEMLVVKYQRRVARSMSRFARAAPEIEDLTQEAFIRAFRGLPNFKGESTFSTWLYRIAVNVGLNHVKQARQTAALTVDVSSDDPDWDGVPEPATHEDPERQMIARQISETVDLALRDLNADGREALLLYEEDGLSYQEIAARTGAPIGTVRARIFRAREFIANRLEPVLGPNRDRRW
jgi:RNA polymerase sigma-70 factor, ECF subfamily